MTAASKAALHALVRAVILFGFTLYILYLSEKGTLNYYIAPRMEIYVKLTGLVLYVLAVQQALHAYRTWRKRSVVRSCDCSSAPTGGLWKHAAVYSFFLFPLILGLFTPDTALGSKLAERKGMNYAASSNLQSIGPASPQANQSGLAAPDATGDQLGEAQRGESLSSSGTESGDADPSPGDADSDDAFPNEERPLTGSTDDSGEAESSQKPIDSPDTPETSPSPGVPLSDEQLEALFPENNALFSGYAKYARSVYNSEIIEVPEHSYTEVLTTLDLYKEQFIGKTVRISGFVYKPTELGADQFAISRYVMQCCSADAAPYGVLSYYPRAASLAEDTWVEITGTIRTAFMNDVELLAIDVSQVRNIEQPSDPYVYPNFEFGL